MILLLTSQSGYVLDSLISFIALNLFLICHCISITTLLTVIQETAILDKFPALTAPTTKLNGASSSAGKSEGVNILYAHKVGIVRSWQFLIIMIIQTSPH